MTRVSTFAAIVMLCAANASASWWETHRADAALDLQAARDHALRTVANDPTSADAVAVAGWWQTRLNSLADPNAIIEAAEPPLDPELAFLLDQIAAEIRLRPPEAALASIEVAGPFGHFDTLDLERDAIPDDRHLPPLGSRWSGPTEVFRLMLRSATGHATPPEPMHAGGVFLMAWTLEFDRRFDGYLVVESNGSVNLEVDGTKVDRLRYCGEQRAAVTWYHFDAAAGFHRIRAAVSDRDLPSVRVSLINRDGTRTAGLRQVTSPETGPWAQSKVDLTIPPAALRLESRLESGLVTVPEALLAAALARNRQDPRKEIAWIRRAQTIAENDPWPALALARLLLFEATGSAIEIDARRAREALRSCRSIPYSLLLERNLAVHEHRSEDVDRLIDDLIAKHGDDPRVLGIWIRHAVRRGWLREAEEAMNRLRTLLPESPVVTDLRLAVLENQERWDERNELLESLADQDANGPQRVQQLAGGCLTDRALAGLRRLRARVDDPVLDLGVVQLLIESGHFREAAAEADSTERKWGPLPGLEKLRMVLASNDPEGDIGAALQPVLSLDPSDLQLRSLAWMHGTTPFFEAYRIDGLDLVQQSEAEHEGIDSILLLDQAVARFFADGSSLYYYHGITKALTAKGARQAAALQQFPNAHLLTVRIIKPDGSIVVPPQLSSRSGSLVLADVTEGDVVEEEYVSSLPPPSLTRRGHLSTYIYRFADPERAFGISEYLVVHPTEIELLIDGNFTGLEVQETLQDDLKVIRWRTERMAPVHIEPLAPPTQELLPWVALGFGLGWDFVGDVTRDRVLPLLRTSPETDEWSAPRLAAGNTLDVVRALVIDLCDEIEAGSSVLEFDSTAGESFSSRKGNRLGIVAAILVKAGYEVDLLLSRPRAFAGTHLVTPSMDVFSLPILRVSRDGTEVWVDITEERSGIDHINPMIQDSDALLLPLSRPDLPTRIFSPLPTFDNPNLEEHLAVSARIDTEGSAKLRVTLPLTGIRAENLVRRLKGLTREQEAHEYVRLAGSLFSGARSVTGKSEQTATGVLVELELVLDQACLENASGLECRDLMPVRALAPALASLPKRQYPLILHIPILQHMELELFPPPGWTYDRPPRRLTTDWGSVDETVDVDGNRLESRLTLRVEAQTVPPGDYPDFARFCHAVDELMLRPPLLIRSR